MAQNTAQILVFRFLGGTFAASPLTNSGALIADIWDARTRGTALAIFTLAPFAGVCKFYHMKFSQFNARVASAWSNGFRFHRRGRIVLVGYILLI